jgi:arsenate reductase (thioredoxin)
MTNHDLARSAILFGMIYRICCVLLLLVVALPAQTAPAKPAAPKTVVFVCEHGAAKSVIAAAYFNKLSAERHLPFHAVARGTTPQPELSKSTIAGLRKDGVSYPPDKPRALTSRDAQGAVRVVALCPVAAPIANTARVDQFDVPAPSDGYEKSRDAILKHVRELIDQLAATPAAAK